GSGTGGGGGWWGRGAAGGGAGGGVRPGGGGGPRGGRGWAGGSRGRRTGHWVRRSGRHSGAGPKPVRDVVVVTGELAKLVLEADRWRHPTPAGFQVRLELGAELRRVVQQVD